MVAILGYSREQIFDAVKDMYTAVADSPLGEFHFPVGREACRLVGYTEEQLRPLPESVVESFAGVGCPFRGEAIGQGDTVLDVGAGAGVDTLVASRLVGAGGHVVALDLTPAMARKLHQAAEEGGAANVSVIQASAEAIPLADESVDAITTNGALNLVPDKRRAVAEMFRVLRPHGRLQIADVVIRRPVTVDCHSDPRLWVECVVGATVDDDLLAMFRDAGFEDVRLVREFDYFAHSPSRQTREVAAGFGARSLEAAMERGVEAPSRVRQWLWRADPRRLARSLWRRGLSGMAGLFMALLACYGTLLVLGVLAVLGTGIAVDDTVWAGAIMLFAVLAAAGIVLGTRRYGHPGPGVTAASGAVIIAYALFVEYSVIVEFSGFVVLAAGAAWDLILNRREQQRILGLRASQRSAEPRTER